MKQWNLQKKTFLKYLFCFFIFFDPVKSEIIFSGAAVITDGDTIKISSNKIRLSGIDAPEIDQKCKKNFIDFNFFSLKKEYFCGKLSKKKLLKFTENHIIFCKVEEKKDFFGRYLGTCFKDKININSWLVKNGYAVAYRKYSKNYIEIEKIAKKNKKGIWQGDFQMPWEWRKNNK